MTRRSFDALCIGNAICDVFSHVEEDFLVRENLVKGSMRLIDTDEAVRLYDKMGQTTRISGGSAGNTAAGIAALGGQTAYFGKVHDDELGTAYRHDMRGTGVHFETPALVEGPPTARSMILITPDGERTMNTYLGACVELSEADIEPETVAKTDPRNHFSTLAWILSSVTISLNLLTLLVAIYTMLHGPALAPRPCSVSRPRAPGDSSRP